MSDSMDIHELGSGAIGILEQEIVKRDAQISALADACEGFAAFVGDYTPDSPLARIFPGFYADLCVHGKNARSAVEQAQKAR